MPSFKHLTVFILLTSFCPIKNDSDKPKLIQLKRSECNDNCKDPDKIFLHSFTDSVYKITFGITLNCCGQDTLLLNMEKDTLKIKVWPTRKSMTRVARANGDSTWFVPYCSCDCYYKFEAEIVDMTRQPKFVSVNQKVLHIK